VTRRSPRKTVDAEFWQGRLRAGRDFLLAARNTTALVEPGNSSNPAISLTVSAAIAYADALTAKKAQVVNQQDHAAAPALLRDVLKNTLPVAQETRYRRILGYKDQVQYGIRASTQDQARKLLADLEDFAAWAEQVL
jgi:microcystin degradation protein MlrC